MVFWGLGAMARGFGERPTPAGWSGWTDLPISNPVLGKALAQKLGKNSVALMRGHGDVVVVSTARKVVYRAIAAGCGSPFSNLRVGDQGCLTRRLGNRFGIAAATTSATQRSAAYDRLGG